MKVNRINTECNMTNTPLFNRNIEQKIKEEEKYKEKNQLFNFIDRTRDDKVHHIYDKNVRICEYCLKKNGFTANICQYCYERLPKLNKAETIKTPRQNEQFTIDDKPKFWLCSGCKVLNRIDRNECECCKKDKSSKAKDEQMLQQVRNLNASNFITNKIEKSISPKKMERSMSPNKRLCIECRKPTSNNNSLCFGCSKKKKICKECSKQVLGTNSICENCKNKHNKIYSHRSTSLNPNRNISKLPTFHQTNRKSISYLSRKIIYSSYYR